MGDDNVQLGIKSTQFLEFAKGDKILVGGEEYSIRTKVTREILSENMYSYDAIFYGVMYELMKSQYRNCDANGKSTKSTFDLTYTLREFMHVVIYNVSRDYPGIWRFDADSCPDTDPVTLQFSKQNCLQVVQTVCKEYKYEFRIDQKDGVRILRVGKFGSKITPPAGNDFFEWGKGNGLYKLKEQKVDDKSIITRLWVEGGTQNIRSDYRDYSERLQLPYPKRLNQREHTLSDGTVIPAKSEYIGIDSDEKRYLEDPDLRNEIGSDEDTEYYDEIYPKRTGTVTALGGDIYSFVDNTMDFDLNEKDSGGTKYLINGVTAKLTFITGKLAGQQFELKEKGGYVHSSRTFNLIKFTDERGMEFPSPDTDAFRFHEGDKYKITDINLPKSYEDYAEEELWYAGYEDFRERKQARAQYVLTFDRSYFINALPLDSETCVFHCGDYVPVKDTRYNIEKNIRIQKMSRNLLIEHDYTLTLSDTTTLSIQAQTVLDVIEHNIIIDNNRLRDLNKARRGWRTTEELRNMVYDTDGYFDVDNIKPNSIDTNMLTVGSKSQQFVLIDTVLQANVNGLPNRFDATEGVLAHLSIDDNAIKKWNMAGTSITLSESGGYYVFAKCSKTTDNGTFYITQEQLRVEPVSDPNNYYFQVGIIGTLHSDDNFRDFVSTYGFTRINGNTITTGKIVTSDGECYLDLDGNKFRIGDATSSIDWNVTAKNQLTLRNVRLLSDSGDLSDLGVYRGVWNAQYIYYKGDEVSYTSNGSTCTYRYINPIPSKGNLPIDSAFWSVVAKGQDGADGSDGAYFEYRYAKNSSNTTPPALSNTAVNPSGWDTVMPALNTLEYLWCTVAKKSASGMLLQNWSTPVRINGVDGGKGDKGDSPATVFRGVYDNNNTYYGTKYRLDVVKYNGVYYVARIDAGTFSGKAPTDTSKWNTFGAQFESVATQLLLAEEANVAGWVFRNNRLESQDGNIFMDGVNGLISVGNGKIILNKDGSGKLADGNVSWDANETLTLSGNLYASRGFRLGVRNVTSNVTLTSSDCFIKSLGSTSIIYLPPSPYTGQLLYFVSQNGSSISINGNGKMIYSGMSGSSSISLGSGCVVQLVYVGGEWYVLSRNG
jgi:hypothetical protein